MSSVYIKKDDVIYKCIPEQEIWIKMTCIKKGEDRRFTSEMLGDNIDIYRYSTQKARTEINDYWNKFKDEWNYYGKLYNNSHPLGKMEVKTYSFNNTEYNSWEIIPEIKPHVFVGKYTWPKTGEVRTYTDKYYLVWHQGHIYWMQCWHYLPQCRLFKFKSIDEEPDINSDVKWTHIRNLRAVWNKTDKKYA